MLAVSFIARFIQFLPYYIKSQVVIAVASMHQ